MGPGVITSRTLVSIDVLPPGMVVDYVCPIPYGATSQDRSQTGMSQPGPGPDGGGPGRLDPGPSAAAEQAVKGAPDLLGQRGVAHGTPSATGTSSGPPDPPSSSASCEPVSDGTRTEAGSRIRPQSRHSTWPSRRIRCTLLHLVQDSKSAVQPPDSWQAGQTSTSWSCRTPRRHGLLPRSGSVCRTPHR